MMLCAHEMINDDQIYIVNFNGYLVKTELCATGYVQVYAKFQGSQKVHKRVCVHKSFCGKKNGKKRSGHARLSQNL